MGNLFEHREEGPDKLIQQKELAGFLHDQVFNFFFLLKNSCIDF